MWLLSWPLCLLALVGLGVLPGQTLGEVVGDEKASFGDCNAFFYHGTPPEGFHLHQEAQPEVVKICQKFNQEPRFATLYSTRDKIPLYSAFRGSEMVQNGPKEKEEERWLVEPQIDDPENGLAGMMPETEVTGSVNNLGTNQALTADYADSGYERGQLNPSSLHKDDHQIAAYTLTNAFPMMPPLQDVWHWEVENLVGRSLAPHCGNGKDLYLISGAVPSSVRVKDKVAVPESLWLAACCDDGTEAWSVGFIKQAAAGNRLEDLSLEELEKKLSAGTQLFKNNCGQDRHDPKRLEAVLQSVKEIQAEEPAPQARKSSPSHQTGAEKEESGFLKKLFYFIVTPLFKLVKFILYLIGQIVKYTFYLLWYLIQTIINGVSTFVKGITSVLLNIFIDLARVAVNILNGIAKNIYNVLMVTYRILSVPVYLILDIVSFPFYTLGAVPAVLQDIASGVGGAFLLVINATTNIVTGLNYVVSYLAKKFLPISSDA
ncbi:endonuclease domain-containing 1 protein [Sceloporus undulatus]|uniref:endonuclease domain-containing 1 protein n=1 Tax=Sceloporus undulatus TaxID=8520 RepID=UPI001C4C95A8|nr:endonuclease domain-containing 1 protein [Sceloporus undulatus]